MYMYIMYIMYIMYKDASSPTATHALIYRILAMGGIERQLPVQVQRDGALQHVHVNSMQHAIIQSGILGYTYMLNFIAYLQGFLSV